MEEKKPLAGRGSPPHHEWTGHAATRLCEFCATELPDHASFCGHCGRAPTNLAEALTGVSEYSTAALNNTPGTTDDQDEEEKRRRAALLGLSIPVVADAMVQARGANVPVVQGTPEAGGVPSVQGTPQSTIPTHHAPLRSADISSQPTHHLLHTSKKPRSAAGGCTRVLLVTFVAVTLIAASIIGAGFTILSPALSLSGSTNVIWGQSIHLHGNHFIPGSIVILTLDGTTPLYYTSREPAIQVSSDANIAAGLAMLIPHIGQINTSTNTVVVSANGTFNVTINVNPNWPVGHHTIRAEEKISRRSAILNFTIQQPEQTPTSTPTLSPTATSSPAGTPSPTATPSPLPSPTTSTSGLSCVTPASITLSANQDSNQPSSKKITLCANGSGMLTWTASWDHNQAPWLQLDHSSGQVQAPGQGQVQASARASGLKPGKYTTTVTFSSQPGSSTLSLAVTFTVQASCVSAKPGTLTFTGGVGSDPQPQTVTVHNCGSAAGNWSASTNANWLTVNPTSGTLDGGATQQVNIAVSLANLKIGTYNEDIVFTLGSSQSTVHVTLTVQAPTLSVQPTSINANNDCHISSTSASGYWVCQVTLTNTSDVQGNLNWSTSSSGVAGITFVPSSGTLAPGASVQVTVDVPDNHCPAPTTLTFVGPANTVNVAWNCTPLG